MRRQFWFSMNDAPSDRDYYEQGREPEPEDPEDDNGTSLPPAPGPPQEGLDELECPF